MEKKQSNESKQYESKQYEAPEVLEIGAAETLTLGFTNRQVPDGCDCTKLGPKL